MTALAVPSQNIAFVESLLHTRWLETSALCLVVWDYFITLDLEIDLYWCGGWSFARVLFFLNRYFGMASVAVSVGVFIFPDVTESVRVHSFPASLSNRRAFQFCIVWLSYLWGGLRVVDLLTVHATTCLRVYGVYGKQKSAIIALIAFSLVTISAVVAVSTVAILNSTIISDPAVDVDVCVYNGIGLDLIYIAWLVMGIFELITLAAILAQTFQPLMMARSAIPAWSNTLSFVVTRESILYFLAVIVSYIGSALVWRFGVDALVYVTMVWATAVNSVAGSRMLLNIRNGVNVFPQSIQNITSTKLDFRPFATTS